METIISEQKTDALKESAQAPGNGKSGFVNYFALIIIVLSGIILILLVAMAWVNFTHEKFTNIEKLFTILLPVIGTWMGTILAFYFSKENFEAANQRVAAMVNKMTTTDEKLQVMKASDVMIKLDTSILMTVADEKAFKEKKLSELIDKLENSHSERMPVLQDGSLKFIFLIYRTTIERFLINYDNGKVNLKEKKDPKPDKSELTVNDMFESDFQLIKEIENCKGCFMPITATLDQVKKAMQDNTICQDVFITKTGNKDEPVEGWITNNIIVEKAELFKKAGTKA